MRWIDLFVGSGVIFKQVVSCGGLTYLNSCLTGFKAPRHAVDQRLGPMHACLLHIYGHALLHPLFIVIYP
jgi:hypothetical protein